MVSTDGTPDSQPLAESETRVPKRWAALVTAAVDEHWGACDLVEGSGFISCDQHDTVVAFPDQPRPDQTAHCWYYQRVEAAAAAAVHSILADLRRQVKARRDKAKAQLDATSPSDVRWWESRNAQVSTLYVVLDLLDTGGSDG